MQSTAAYQHRRGFIIRIAKILSLQIIFMAFLCQKSEGLAIAVSPSLEKNPPAGASRTGGEYDAGHSVSALQKGYKDSSEHGVAPAKNTEKHKLP
jgi:hypothetical protein